MSTRKSKSRVSSPSPESTLLFQSTKCSSSAQTAACQIEKQRSNIQSAGDIRESSSEDVKIYRVKRRKVVDRKSANGETTVDSEDAALGEKSGGQRSTTTIQGGQTFTVMSERRFAHFLYTLVLPTVHSAGKVNHILRVFDLSYEYGPCVGVNRLQRWEHANILGFSPPQEVYEILMTQEGSEKTSLKECVLCDSI